ncbi:hypothetical protein B0H11DRAFT_1962642 [Mycena galericulata]|nr:hypothetical protein B0H11DRAFT_1962642 [Mycena galericulata]
MISTLTLEQYHQTCSIYLVRKSEKEDTRNHNIQLGAVYCSFLIPNVWEIFAGDRSLVVMDNGWTRFTHPCDEQIGITLSLWVHASYNDNWNKLVHGWLSQANHIFRQYPITAHYEDYALVWYIEYELTLLPAAEIHPDGHLFLCPLDDLKSEDGGFIGQPECPAYWSLDPSGCERLSPGEASAHGFPSFEWERSVYFKRWEEHVYAGLSQFYAGKGFDPYSQDVARHLGLPLYELSRVSGPLGAHIEEIPPESDVGTPATIKDEDPLQHEDDDQIEGNHRQNDQTVFGIAGQKTEQMDRRLAARDCRFIISGALGVVIALSFAFLYSL